MITGNVDLSERQRRVVDTFREYGTRTFTESSVRQWREDQGLPDDVVKEFASLYFQCVDDEGDAGRAPGTLLTQALILEELSCCAGITLPFQNDLFGLQIMAGFASYNDVSAVISDYRSNGRVMFALAVSEPQAGSDSMNMTTSVHMEDGRLLLNGVKTFVNNGEYAPNIMVAAIDADSDERDPYPPLSFWFIPRNLEGITAYPINKIGQSMLPFATVSFDNVELKPEYRLAGPKKGFRGLFSLLETGRIFTCASSLGMAQAAMRDAVAYATERTAFGTHVSDFQQIEQMMTDMEVRLWNMRNFLYQAAVKIDTDAPDKRLAVALMKRYIPAAATAVASEAMQIMGGVGYTENERIARIWQDCRGNQLAEGTDEIMVYIAAPLIKEKYSEAATSSDE